MCEFDHQISCQPLEFVWAYDKKNEECDLYVREESWWSKTAKLDERDAKQRVLEKSSGENSRLSYKMTTMCEYEDNTERMSLRLNSFD